MRVPYSVTTTPSGKLTQLPFTAQCLAVAWLAANAQLLPLLVNLAIMLFELTCSCSLLACYLFNVLPNSFLFLLS